MRVFISHSAKDGQFVGELRRLLHEGVLGLPFDQIRASSIEGSQFQGGAGIDPTIQREVDEAEALIAVLSLSSLQSHYVMFEMGARWGAGKPFIPLLVPGMQPDHVGGPLRQLKMITCAPEQLYELVTDTGAALDLPCEPSEQLTSQITRVISAHPGYEPLRFAVLSYVVDTELTFALLTDHHYQRLQPPGRKLEPGDRPHEVARDAVVDELDLPTETLTRFPPFDYRTYGNTTVVPSPFQVQVERGTEQGRLHRTAQVHYDFVYVFTVSMQRPRLAARKTGGHKADPQWLSIDAVRARVDTDIPPHADMLPTMERIRAAMTGTMPP